MFTETAPAKINLGLHILCRRTDGYHDLSTVFHPIGWADTVTAGYADKISMTCTDATLSSGEDNLVIRAARFLGEVVNTDRGAFLHLEKVLPHGAGLGGGSSNATASLRLLCKLWELDGANLGLDSIALRLGSDVPFFLQRCTAYGEGRGERLTPMTDYTFPFSLAVIVPPVYVPTAWAFQQVHVSGANRVNLIDVVQSNDLDRWRRELVNDFEKPIFSQWSAIQEAKSLLLRSGAGYASLTGSGAGLYGVFESGKDAKEAAEEAKAIGYATWYQDAASSGINLAS